MSNGGANPSPDTLVIKFEKSKHYRVVHVDGCFGGPSPNGLLVFCPYSERNEYPTETEYKLSQDGKLGEEIRREGLANGIRREMEVELVMNLTTAKSLQTWLNSKIEILEGILTKEKANNE